MGIGMPSFFLTLRNRYFYRIEETPKNNPLKDNNNFKECAQSRRADEVQDEFWVNGNAWAQRGSGPRAIHDSGFNIFLASFLLQDQWILNQGSMKNMQYGWLHSQQSGKSMIATSRRERLAAKTGGKKTWPMGGSFHLYLWGGTLLPILFREDGANGSSFPHLMSQRKFTLSQGLNQCL